MKKKVNLSTWCMVMTVICLVVLSVPLYYAKDSFAKCLAAGALGILCLTALFFMPLSVSVKDGDLNINRPLKIKSIPLSQIASVKLWSPTMAERRICGAGGWFGYYGWFKEPSIGKYFAYYGRASDCFLVTLKNGKKYVLGCENPSEMVAFINGLINKPQVYKSAVV